MYSEEFIKLFWNFDEEKSTDIDIDACQGGEIHINSTAKSESNEHPFSKSLQLNNTD